MGADKFCPVREGLVCGPGCGLYSEMQKRCSVGVLVDALLSLTQVKGRAFTAWVKTQGRITIPLDVREAEGLKEGDRVRIALLKEAEA